MILFIFTTYNINNIPIISKFASSKEFVSARLIAILFIILINIPAYPSSIIKNDSSIQLKKAEIYVLLKCNEDQKLKLKFIDEDSSNAARHTINNLAIGEKEDTLTFAFNYQGTVKDFTLHFIDTINSKIKIYEIGLIIGKDTLQWKSLQIIDAFYFGKGIKHLNVIDSYSTFELEKQPDNNYSQEGRYIKLKSFASQTLKLFQKYPLIGHFEIEGKGDTLNSIFVNIRSGLPGLNHNYTINSSLRGEAIKVNFPIYGNLADSEQVEFSIYFGNESDKFFLLKRIIIDINDIYYTLKGSEILKYCEIGTDLKLINENERELLIQSFNSNPNKQIRPTLNSIKPIVSRSNHNYNIFINVLKTIIYVLLFIFVNGLIIYLTKPIFNKS